MCIRDSAYNANMYSNMLGPVNAQIGNLSYVLCALAGGVMALSGFGGLTLGTVSYTHLDVYKRQ